MLGGWIVDNFMDKLAQKLSAQEMIKANARETTGVIKGRNRSNLDILVFCSIISLLLILAYRKRCALWGRV